MLRRITTPNGKRNWVVAFRITLITCLSVCYGFQLSSDVLNSASMTPVYCRRYPQAPLPVLHMSSETREDDKVDPSTITSDVERGGWFVSWLRSVDKSLRKAGKRPPAQVDDVSLLFYDIFLIVNLSVSISFYAAHRMDIIFLGSAFSEGCLMSLLWIGSGLYTGAFLFSAVDGHYGSNDERGGPRAAGLLGFQTYLNAVNMRLLFALLVAVVQHRSVGTGSGEELLPLEIGFGLVLMGCWRALHSASVPRI